MSIYQQMLELAIANGLPLHHKDDLLLHDKRWLEENPGKPFLWLLYESGTHLLILDEESDLRRAGLVSYINEAFGHGPRNEVPPSKWFYCDGESIGAQIASEAIERARAFDLRGYEGPMGERPYDNWKAA